MTYNSFFYIFGDILSQNYPLLGVFVVNIDKKDAEKFTRLKIHSITSLAIIAPISYEDYQLHNRLQENKLQMVDATVEQIHRSPRRTLITLYAHNFGHRIEAVLFNPKPYQLRHFIIGEQHFFYGKVSCQSGHCQISHPQQIENVGTITPKYKTVLRSDVHRRLLLKYLNLDNLLKEGLLEAVAILLLSIHFPEQDQGNRLSNHQLQALKFAELFEYMKQLQEKRRYFPSLFKLRGSWKQWSDTLPFTLTTDQVNTITSVAEDLSKDIAAKRMIVGDVGSGKTMVILASALIAQPKRAILMAPTTILAKQLFEEAQKHLPQLKSILIQNSTKKTIDLTTFDFIIGTHALLYRELPEAGLIMIDEQHRFGTAQRNLLEKLVTGVNTEKTSAKKIPRPHFLQFSATPIPRTQAMIDASHIDVSLMIQTPFEKDITTEVIHKEDFKDLLKKVEAELQLEHQVLIIYPLVEPSDAIAYQSIEEARGYWVKKFTKVYITHGKDKNKEQVLSDFSNQGNILLSTTVVEVGISLPKLTTIVIVGAERLGLSTLHQLRGRVSRNGLKGYCYLYTNQNKSKRLDAFIETNNGFDIAELDLKFRKSGDLLAGKEQSGEKFKWINMAEDERIVSKVAKHLKSLSIS